MNRHPLRVFTDRLQNEKREMGDFPLDIDPVDAFGGYVAIDKYAPDNLARTQENIGWKVQLKPTYPWETTTRKK